MFGNLSYAAFLITRSFKIFFCCQKNFAMHIFLFVSLLLIISLFIHTFFALSISIKFFSFFYHKNEILIMIISFFID
ncbi:hypothetical protein ATX37_05770 [Oenococcus oeni]|nr:hypothetical protein X289_00815 [Oenococcus oeni IOEB_B10]OIL81337.1 hypothetical protein ATX37_05770 [Oenococcus oeni]OIM45543.1 hypothetical protein ATX75_06030 [Oenococcus oeni]OIM71045.1 hypothetical protein ATX90_06130 [Oenococcus oeni]OIM76461.1 hypothetical protein ATX93_06185 [Oenococcus oeni]